jgi:hypothetical protein
MLNLLSEKIIMHKLNYYAIFGRLKLRAFLKYGSAVAHQCAADTFGRRALISLSKRQNLG